MEPEFKDETPINPFDFWAGANFKLKIRFVEGYRNYDKSEFSDPSELLDGDDTELEKVYKSLYSLKNFTDPKNFKSFADLEAKMKAVLGDQASVISQKSAEDLAKVEDAPSPGKSVESVKVSAPAPKAETPDLDDDDADIDYFKKLAAS